MGTRFIFYWFTIDLASSYLKGCNFIRAVVSTPSNCMGHSVFLLWGSESQGFISRWFIMGGSWIFLGFHGLQAQAPFVFGSSKFLVLSASGLTTHYHSQVLSSRTFQFSFFIHSVKPVGSSVPASVQPLFSGFYYFYKGFIIGHLTLSMMGVAGILGGALLSAIHGATVVNTIYQDGNSYSTFRAFSPTQPEQKYTPWLQQIDFGLKSLVYFLNKRWLHFSCFLSHCRAYGFLCQVLLDSPLIFGPMTLFLKN